MKKKYQKPLSELVVVRCKDKLLWGEMGNAGSNNFDHTDAKQNVIIFEEFIEEEPDTTDFWNNDPWKIQYSLWDEE
jgi:hypothetical protein